MYSNPFIGDCYTCLMDMDSTSKHPFYSLLLLLGLTFASSFFFQLLLALISRFLFDVSLFRMMEGDVGAEHLIILKISLLVGSLATFLIPALWLQRKERQFHYFPAKPIEIRPFLWVLLALFAFVPIMDFIADLNQNMRLPDSLKAVENWMYKSEKEAEGMMKMLVMDDSWLSFLLNILVLAIAPAIVEEYFFRGVLQGIFIRWFGSVHVAVFVTAILFSAIHLQFYGFLPRFLLGLFFGYLMVWSKNIWLPIWGHFINNFMVTLLAFIYSKQGKTFEELQASIGFSTILYIFSALITGLIISLIYQRFKNKDMEKDWTKIREFNNEIHAEMVKQMLEANGIPAVLMNKKDSSYLFGKLELFVNQEYVEQAVSLIENEEDNLNEDES